MGIKSFVWLVGLVMVVSASIGGAFVGGVALGTSQDKATEQGSLPGQSLLSLQAQLGELGQEQLIQLRESLLGEARSLVGGAQRAGSGGAVGGLTGTIESTEGTSVIVGTTQGPLKAVVGTDIPIQIFAPGAFEDLKDGMVVTIIGQRDEDGTVQAQSIVVIPEGGRAPFRGRGG